MEQAHELVFIGSLLLLAGIVAGMLSTRVGAPLLLAFLGLGMVAGDDGLGLHFASTSTAYLIGSAALALILFDGGLHTRRRVFRLALGPSVVLASVGVAVTATVAGAAAVFLLQLGWLQGLLIGAIVSSTDAAAVFLLLHQRGRDINERVAATLETEAGFNDPFAVFLTTTLVTLASGHGDQSFAELLYYLAREALLGAAIGVGGGMLLVQLVNRLTLAGGLQPILAMAAALCLFAGTQLIDGSGFLAVYLAGLIAGNSRLKSSQTILRFHEGMAWLSQLVLFIMLGLLVTPHRLLPQAPAALGVALVVILAARPLAVWICLTPFRFTVQERLFIAWVGLRGAVPIFLAMIPTLARLPHSEVYFHVAFLVVLASLVLQGWTVAPAARWLRLEMPSDKRHGHRLDLEIAAAGSREISAYRVPAGAPALDRSFEQLPLPRRTRIIAVLRDGVVMNRAQLDRLQPNDVVLALTPPETLEMLDKLFAERRGPLAETALGDFVLDPNVPMATVVDLYGLPATLSDRAKTVGVFLRQRIGRRPVIGDRIHLGLVDLIVRALDDDRITEIGVVLEPERDPLDSVSIRRRLKRLAGGARRVVRRRRAAAGAGGPHSS
ncbi:K+/H+ antiporter [Aliidongia dinghuensis]|uniref:K+/H+ antiporter n=1 Tax=Aliidongia dinghuensis TaxID=1867774 RepID=A0A8J2YSP2_9PROT|nr:potassium/proton antiporter [Aliidongia dinghuensis]GGF16540.1 K+/H+ antiporter [Aliidongia dinghuensis]